jgi:hypothetical protein
MSNTQFNHVVCYTDSGKQAEIENTLELGENLKVTKGENPGDTVGPHPPLPGSLGLCGSQGPLLK